MNFNFNFNIYHHGDGEKLEELSLQGKKILSQIEELMTRLDAATTRQGEQLVVISDAIQEIGQDITTLIASAGETLSPELLAKMQALAEKAEAVSSSLEEQAAFSKEIAAKYPTELDPVPEPLPEPEFN